MKTTRFLFLVAVLALVAGCSDNPVDSGAPDVITPDAIEGEEISSPPTAPRSTVAGAANVGGSSTTPLSLNGDNCTAFPAVPVAITYTVSGSQLHAGSFKVNTKWDYNGTTFVGSNPTTINVPIRSGAPTSYPVNISVENSNQTGTGATSFTIVPFDLVTDTSDPAGQQLNLNAGSNVTVNVQFSTCATPNTAPTLVLPTIPPVEATSSAGALVNFMVTATDEEDGDLTDDVVCTPASGSTFPLGETTVNCSVTDSGPTPKTTTGSFIVEVVDTTPPTVTVTFPDPPATGWFKTSPVVGQVTASDLVKVADIECTGATVGTISGTNTTSASAPITVSGEGTHNVSCTATDGEGNSSAADGANNTAEIKIDTVAPEVSPGDVSDATWRKDPLSQAFTASDATSGLADPADASFPLTAADESANASTPTTVSKTVSDKAGNSTTRTLSALIDKTNPVVSVTGVSQDDKFRLGVDPLPTLGCTTSDALSGVKTNASLQALSGGPIGAITATCSGAEDNAGNAGSASVTYSVIYNWTGFFRPVDNLPTWNSVKAGQAIPVKFSLDGDQGLAIFAAGSPMSAKCACDASAPLENVEETVTAGQSSLSYDPLTKEYNYVWKTDKAWAGPCRQLTVKLADDQVYTAKFKFTK